MTEKETGDGRDSIVKNKATYRVWIEQVNQTFVDVKATSEEEARVIGYAKWRVEEAHSRVTSVEKQKG